MRPCTNHLVPGRRLCALFVMLAASRFLPLLLLVSCWGLLGAAAAAAVHINTGLAAATLL